ncbi:MAG: beta-N-acetylhexosaminidase [Reichenbachiella sp.]
MFERTTFIFIIVLVQVTYVLGGTISVIPQPQVVQENDKTAFSLTSPITIVCDSNFASALPWLLEMLKPIDAEPIIYLGSQSDTVSATITVQSDDALFADASLHNDYPAKHELRNEAYSIDVSSQGIVIAAEHSHGLFNAFQTIRQLLPHSVEVKTLEKTVEVPSLTIHDWPAYEWRGSMIDVARHFFSVDILKRHIERIALFKINRLHLHLSDDQGWRLEIKSRPKLTEIGGTSAVNDDGGGFYSQDEMREIIEYAEARHITIVPEFDMPGHIQAALASYPELACAGKNTDLYYGTEVGFSSLCLTDDAVYDFVEDVFTEVVDLFPGPYIHLGGDEIESEHFEAFVTKADKIITDKGKTTIGWQEILKAELEPTTIVQSWRKNSSEVYSNALSKNHAIILSPCGWFYLDHANFLGQENTLNWCTDFIPLSQVYSFPTDDFSKALGIEAPVWSEYVVDGPSLENRFWPRIIATSEVAWSPQELRNWDSFSSRLATLGERLDNLGIHFYREPSIAWNGNNTPIVGLDGLFTEYTPSMNEWEEHIMTEVESSEMSSDQSSSSASTENSSSTESSSEEQSSNASIEFSSKESEQSSEEYSSKNEETATLLDRVDYRVIGDYVHIETNNSPPIGQLFTIDVITIHGKVIASHRIHESQSNFSIQAPQIPGVYVVHLNSRSKKSTRIFTVQ